MKAEALETLLAGGTHEWEHGRRLGVCGSKQRLQAYSDNARQHEY